jgi:hypothetical protein
MQTYIAKTILPLLTSNIVLYMGGIQVFLSCDFLALYRLLVTKEKKEKGVLNT